MSRPTLSVLMANYNHGRYLRDSIPAILAQSYEPVELVIVDDASTDDSVEILERFAREVPKVRFLRNERNRGTLYTINRAIAESSGDYLCFCSADDMVLPGLFERSIDLLEEYPAAGACTSIVRVMGADGDDQGIFQPLIISEQDCFVPPKRAEVILRRQGTWYMGPGAVYRRAAFLDCGGLRSELGAMCDDFLFMVIALRHGVCHIPAPLAVWRRMEGTYSSSESASRDRLNVIARAVDLMKTTYRSLFPPALTSRCEGRWLFSLRARNSSALLRPWLFLRFRARDLLGVILRRGAAWLRNDIVDVVRRRECLNPEGEK